MQFPFCQLCRAVAMNKKAIYIFLGTVCLIALSGAVLAQVSFSYDVRWSRFASGGGERQSGSFVTQDILGQWIYGNPSSTNHEIVVEFFDADFPFEVYLPTIPR